MSERRALTGWTGWTARHPDGAVAIMFALAASLPMFWTSPGQVSADTKSYLTLDPDRLLARATTMWDPLTGAGTVPHQNIGYLFPLGPYYWLMERLAVPDWITQRLIWATLVFAAALGAYRLARWLGWSLAGAVVVGVGYGFSPYLLSYLARLSVILGPWAAMPWLILLAARAARTRSWRPAAVFALVVLLVGSVNATALVLAGLGPVLWLVADVAAGRVRWRAALAAAMRIGVLSAAVSLWWIVALRVQGSFGIPILRYTETYQTVAGASTPAEIVRGLGYWFFYGGDRLDPWVGPSLPYVDAPLVIALGLAIAGISLLGLLTAFSGRAAALVLLLVGLAVSVGAAPLGDSSLYGSVFEWWATNSTAGMALRSTPRAAPLVVLALAFGLGAASEWARRRLADRPSGQRRSFAAPAIAIALVIVQVGPWFSGAVLTSSLLRDETLPDHQLALAAWLNETVDDPDDPGGRVYEMPAADFAYYRWGGTVDPVLPGIIDRPYLARELVPQGGMATIDLLDAMERRIPEGWFEPEGLRAFAELFAVETLTLRNDLEHERLRLARPGQLWTDVSGALGTADHAGELVVDTPVIPILDEVTLAHPDAAEEFPVVAAFEIGSGDAVRAVAAASPMIVSGSGDGLVDLAGTGLLETDRPVLYAATLDDLASRHLLPSGVLGTSPWWVLTDTNRKEARHWSGVSSNRGALEPDGEIRLDDDPADSRLDVFPDIVDQQTRAVHLADVAAVRASYYGNRIAFTPEDAPWFAIDGDPATAWRAGVFDAAEGLVWEVDLAAPVAPTSTTTTVEVLQPTTGVTTRYITSIDITLDGPDGTTTVRADLDERSRAEPGQSITLPGVTFDSLRIEVRRDNLGPLANYGAHPGVGLAEVRIPGVVDDRVTDVPGLGDFPALDPGDVTDDRLTYVLTRQRIDPATSNRTAPEPAMSRRIDVSGDRTFELRGEARLAADAPEATLAAVLGDDGAAIGDRRLPGSVAARGQSAFDGDLTTAWQTPFGDQTGATLTLPAELSSRSVPELTISWLDDGQHSPPTAVALQRADGSTETIELATVESETVEGVATASVTPTSPDPIVAIGIASIAPVTSPEYFSGVEQVLPVGIAEIVIGQLTGSEIDDDSREDGAGTLDTGCRGDLATIDGEPLPVRIVGERTDAIARGELVVEACDTIELAAGAHRLDVVAGSETGIDLDRIVLDSPGSDSSGGSGGRPAGIGVTARGDGPTRIDVTMDATGAPTWLILRQSWNPGWTATLDGVDLGEPVLVDGYANGWIVPASSATRTITLEWTPQGTVTIALWMSLVAAIAVSALALVSRRREIALADGDGHGRHLLGTGALAVVVGAALVVVAGPLVAAGSMLTAFVARRRPSLAVAVVLASGTIVAGSIVALEWRRDLPADPQWPSQFGWTAPLVWLVVGTVVCSGLLAASERRRPAVVSRPRAHSDRRADSQRGGEHR